MRCRPRLVAHVETGTLSLESGERERESESARGERAYVPSADRHSQIREEEGGQQQPICVERLPTYVFCMRELVAARMRRGGACLVPSLTGRAPPALRATGIQSVRNFCVSEWGRQVRS